MAPHFMISKDLPRIQRSLRVFLYVEKESSKLETIILILKLNDRETQAMDYNHQRFSTLFYSREKSVLEFDRNSDHFCPLIRL